MKHRWFCLSNWSMWKILNVMTWLKIIHLRVYTEVAQQHCSIVTAPFLEDHDDPGVVASQGAVILNICTSGTQAFPW